jgi:hypothetical protein
MLTFHFRIRRGIIFLPQQKAQNYTQNHQSDQSRLSRRKNGRTEHPALSFGLCAFPFMPGKIQPQVRLKPSDNINARVVFALNGCIKTDYLSSGSTHLSVKSQFNPDPVTTP